MKMILGSWIHRYLKKLSIFLITVALVAGLVGCESTCAPLQYALYILGTLGGAVTISGDGTYADGTVVMLEAVADECYEFVNWTGANVADPYSQITTITMDEAKSITANFALLSYDLTIGSTDGGQVTSPGEDTFTYDCGTEVALVATAEEGYYFINWTGNVSTISDINAPTTTITMMGDYSITANFELIPPGQFVLTTSSTTGGSVTTPGEGNFPYDEGTVVDLVAESEECYEFINWTGDTVADPNSATTSITMDGAKNVTANFEQIPPVQFTLTISSTARGSVTEPGKGTFTYYDGTMVNLVAEADEGYQFVNWTGNVSTIANVNSALTAITTNDSYSIRANFLESSSIPPGINYTEVEVEQLIIVLVNAERQQFNLTTLSEDALLTSLAREHSISMVENDFFGHERYPGERPLSYNQSPGTIRGENLAMMPTRQYVPGPYLSLQEVCEWAVSGWMDSPGHRANILEPRYTITGVGVSFSDDWDYLYITQIFEGAY
jgi:uncharacterized protein YkwD